MDFRTSEWTTGNAVAPTEMLGFSIRTCGAAIGVGLGWVERGPSTGAAAGEADACAAGDGDDTEVGGLEVQALEASRRAHQHARMRIPRSYEPTVKSASEMRRRNC
jgi:hypothetical protein